jgi:glycosyltransferase involved in cell wall biosynthesis
MSPIKNILRLGDQRRSEEQLVKQNDVSYQRVALLPNPVTENPVLYLLARSLEKCGVKICRSPGYLNSKWLWSKRHEIDVLHLHWPEIEYRRASRFRCAFKVGTFALKLLFARILGYKTVWTVHNILPHERDFPVLEYLGHFFAAQLSYALIVQCQEAKKLVRKYYGRKRRVFLIPHGNYIGFYPNEINEKNARRQVGIPEDALVFLFFGAIRPYKGVENLITAFSMIDGKRSWLVIAGKPHDDNIRRRIERQSSRLNNVKLFLDFVPVEKVQLFMRASDIVVLPYTRVTTSGAVMLAFSFGKPVIAPAIGCLPEVLDESRGILYKGNSVENLKGALIKASKMDVRQLGINAKNFVKSIDWDYIAGETLKVYQS